MKTPLLYGCLMTLVTAITTFALFFAGFHESAEKVQATQWVGIVIGIVAGVSLTALSIRARRAEYPADKEWGYGPAAGTAVLTTLYAVLTGAIFTYVYFAYINPGMTDIVKQLQAAKMQAQGRPEIQIEQAMKFMSPALICIFQAVFAFVVGAIVSLIIAIFFRNPLPRVESPELAVPPAV